jgi:hypothetical protein
MTKALFTRRLRITLISIAITLLAALLLLTIMLRMRRTGWYAIPNASVTINGVITNNAKVYYSPNKKNILIYPGDTREVLLYLVSLRQKRLAVTYESDFITRTALFALPNGSFPLHDWIPNEFDDSTDPHLSISGSTIQFMTFHHLNLKIRY